MPKWRQRRAAKLLREELEAMVAETPITVDTIAITDLKRGQCRYALSSGGTEAQPTYDHHFCGQPVTSSKDGKPLSYCAEHARKCSGGKGVSWQSLAAMMTMNEHTVVHTTVAPAGGVSTMPVDEELKQGPK